MTAAQRAAYNIKPTYKQPEIITTGTLSPRRAEVPLQVGYASGTHQTETSIGIGPEYLLSVVSPA